MKIYQSILESESGKDLLAHRALLSAKILCIDTEWKKQIYRECIESVDNALQQVFDLFYQSEPEQIRIDDLITFWQEIDS